jgi:hypothetical protein
MAVFLSTVGGVAAQFFTNNGVPLSGGKLYTYVAGTTTPAATYTSSSGSTPHANPIVLDSGGRVPGGETWLTDGTSYKFVLKDSADVLIATYDNIVGINSNFVNFFAQEEVQIATAGQTGFTLANSYVPGANTLSVFVDGVNQYNGSTYSYVETSSNTVTFASGLHVGALVKFTTVQSLTSGQQTDAALVTYNEGGTGAVTYTVRAKLQQTVSVKDFGAVGDGVTDDTLALQAAITATPSGGYLVLNPGVYVISDTLTIPVSMTVDLYGTLKPRAQPATQRPMISITANYVTIDGHGVGGFNGISSAYNKFDAVWAFGPSAAAIGLSGYLVRPRIINCIIQNMGVQSSTGTCIVFQAIDQGEISNIVASNIGQTSAFVNAVAPYFFYGEFNRDLLIENVVATNVGNTFISVGASLNDVVRNCTGKNVTLFPFKAGFGGPTHAVTADVTPAVSNQGIVFSIANTDYNKARFARGMHFCNISDNTPTIAEGTVESQGDAGAYLIITTMAPMALPAVGNAMLEMSSGCMFDNCKVYYSGLEGYDLNMMYGLNINNPYIRGAGMLRISGSLQTFSTEVASGIWVGADPYGGNVNVHSTGVTINGADIECCLGSGIQIDGQAHDVVIDNYRIFETGIGSDLTQTITPVSYGISINKYSANRCQRVLIGQGTISTYRGGGILYSYSTGGHINGAEITAPTGIYVPAANTLWITDCSVTATAPLNQVWCVKYDSPGPSMGYNYITNNSLYVSSTVITGGATTAFGILLSAAVTQPIYVQPGNRVTSAVTTGTFTTVGGAGVANAVYTNQVLP